MLNIGCHLSAAKGFESMGKNALSIDANTFQFFTRNPRGAKAKQIDQKDVQRLLDIIHQHHFAPLTAHAPYTLNPCSADPAIREFALKVMKEDLQKMELLPHNYYNFHPGSHVKQGTKKGIALIADTLNQVLKPEQTTTVLLETMAGKGTEIGRCFEELRAILDKVELCDKMGICMDTCHVHDGGYDIVNNLDHVLNEFDAVIGLDKLKAIHLNDSKNPINSHKDRHAVIGGGYIGTKAIVKIITHPKLCHLPFYLETPNELEGYQKEIQLLREQYDAVFSLH